MTRIALAALVALLALTVLDLAPPSPRPVGAPADAFSAGRAHEHVRAIARAPHPPGSAEHTRVREHLVTELRELGLDVRVQEGVGVLPLAGDGVTPMGTMRNVVAVRPGTAPTGRVVLAAHYDSVAAGPGASDDGAGVATILEVARALTRSPRNDVVFLLTDGEEQGLLGAEAFVRTDPLAKGTVVVLNNEARGVRGTVQMFRTSPGSGPLVEVYGRAAPHPSADSAFAALLSLLPNNTDFHVFDEAGWLGLDSAFIGGGAYYHTPLDDPAHLDQGSLQQMGDNALALTRALADADLPALRSGEESVYFTVPGALIRYPLWLETPIAVAALLLAVFLTWTLRGRVRAPAGTQGTAGTAGTAPEPASSDEDGKARTSTSSDDGWEASTSTTSGADGEVRASTTSGADGEVRASTTSGAGRRASTSAAAGGTLLGRASLPRVAAAAGLALLAVLVAGAAGYAIMPLLALINPAYGELFTGDPYRPWLFQAALLVFTTAIVLAWRAALLRVGAAALAAGALVLVAALGQASALALPGGSHTMTWPALFAALGWLIARRLRRPGWQAAVLALGLAPAVILLGGTALTSLDVGLAIGGAIATSHLALLLLLLLPLIDHAWPAAGRSASHPSASAQPTPPAPAATQLAGHTSGSAQPTPQTPSSAQPIPQTPSSAQPAGHTPGSTLPPTRSSSPGARPRAGRRSALPPLVTVALAVALMAAGLYVDRFDAAHPQQTRLSYALDAATGQAVWGSRSEPSAADSERFFGSDGWATKPAQAASGLRAPGLSVVKDETAAGRRTLTVRLTPTGSAPITGLSVLSPIPTDSQPRPEAVASGSGTGALITVNGRRLSNGSTGFAYHAPARTLEVTLVLPEGQAHLRAFEQAHDLSAVPGYRPPADTVVVNPLTTVFQVHSL